MKKAKKMALQAMVCAAFAAAMVLAGCSTEEGGDSDIIETTSGNGAKIDADNTTEYENRRGFKSTGKTRWSEAAYEITIDESNGNNVMGFMFNESENTDGTKNFFLFGVRLNAAGTGLDAYLSYFPNVDEKKNLTSNVDTFYSSEAASQEKTIMKGDGNKAYFPLVTDQKRVIIHVTQVKDTTQQGDPYVYVVKAYKSISADGTLTNEITLKENGAKSLRDYPNTGKTEKWDNYMGFYANVKKGGNLKGSWTAIKDTIVTAVEVAEAE